MKTIFICLLTAICICLVGAPGSLAGETLGQNDEQAQGIIRDNEASGSKVRVLFLEEIRGEPYIFIRLTVDQNMSAKRRASRKDWNGMVRLVLHPRQLSLLNDILQERGLDKVFAKFLIRTPASVVEQEGIKALYVVRPLDFFASNIGRGKAGGQIDEDNPIVVPE